MNKHDLLEAIGSIDPAYIKQADAPVSPGKQIHPFRWLLATGLLLTLAVIVTIPSGMKKDAANNGSNSYSPTEKLIINDKKNLISGKDDAQTYAEAEEVPGFLALLDALDLPADFKADGTLYIISSENNAGGFYSYLKTYTSSDEKRYVAITMSDEHQITGSSELETKHDEVSVLHGVPLKIFHGEADYIGLFSYKGINFKVETHNLVQDELIKVFVSIIKED